MNIGDFLLKEGEQPLERMVTDGGFCSIFRRIGCIGDSLASGELESKDENGNIGYHDLFEYSWGQYLARLCGSEALNFSRGGMTAKEFWDSFGEKAGTWKPENACPAYILALGENDFHHPGPLGNGTAADILPGNPDKPDTFVGYFARIIEKLRLLQPKSRIFLVTMPRKSDPEQDPLILNHAELMHAIADAYEYTYVIDLLRYGPTYHEKFRNTFFLSGHMSPAGYLLTARLFASYIDYIIRKNPDDFRQVGFIGTGFYHVDYKW